MSKYDGLNEQQRAAVTAGLGPVLVLAGPGSGKTRVLTYRIAYLIEEMKAPPMAIMAVTFTNKAAAEMRERVERLQGAGVRGLQIGTFHAICARLLRREHNHTPYGSDYVIFDTDDQSSAVAQAMGELNIDTKKFTPRRILGGISAAKSELIEPEHYIGSDYVGEVVGRVYRRYQAILQDNNAMDFDDLLMQMAILLRDNDEVREKYQRFYDFVLVDEFQDTNTAQYRLVEYFGKPRDNVFVVGDEDQGIYAFRGADYRNVLQFRRDYPDAQVILLEQNYRSTQNVLDAARAVIDRNPNRTPKALFTDRGSGESIILQEAYNEDFEARYVMEQIDELRRAHGYGWGDFAIMYRTNAQSRALEEACIREGLPYKLVGGVGFYKRREVRDLLAYLRLVNNPNDKLSFNRIINVPKRGIGKKSLTDFHAWAANALDNNYDQALQILNHGGETSLSGRSVGLFADFGRQIAAWRAVAATGDLVELFDRIVGDTGYTFYLTEISDSDEQATERTENLRELRGRLQAAQEAERSLSEFLTDEALVADVDELEATGEAVTLLTLHAAKGLEYPVVFITGLEEGLLPHARSLDDPEGMSEERRLFYVGITRARDHLYMTYAFRRSFFGSSAANAPSRFLADIPSGLMEGLSTRLSGDVGRQLYDRATRWEAPGTQTDRTPRTFSNDKARSKILPFPGSEPKDPTFPSGQRVMHSLFGVGMVIESKGTGDDEEVTVAFEDKKYGIKKFLASFANLTPLKG